MRNVFMAIPNILQTIKRHPTYSTVGLVIAAVSLAAISLSILGRNTPEKAITRSSDATVKSANTYTTNSSATPADPLDAATESKRTEPSDSIPPTQSASAKEASRSQPTSAARNSTSTAVELPPSPTPNPDPATAYNPNASFLIEFVEGGGKDKTTNTLFTPFKIVHEPGHTAEVSVSTAGSDTFKTCRIVGGNRLEMTLANTLPANFYGCNLVATDGKTTKYKSFSIHHSGGPTNN